MLRKRSADELAERRQMLHERACWPGSFLVSETVAGYGALYRHLTHNERHFSVSLPAAPPQTPVQGCGQHGSLACAGTADLLLWIVPLLPEDSPHGWKLLEVDFYRILSVCW